MNRKLLVSAYAAGSLVLISSCSLRKLPLEESAAQRSREDEVTSKALSQTETMGQLLSEWEPTFPSARTIPTTSYLLKMDPNYDPNANPHPKYTRKGRISYDVKVEADGPSATKIEEAVTRHTSIVFYHCIAEYLKNVDTAGMMMQLSVKVSTRWFRDRRGRESLRLNEITVSPDAPPDMSDCVIRDLDILGDVFRAEQDAFNNPAHSPFITFHVAYEIGW